MTDKIFGIIRMGTVLGEGMPEKTAANVFINRGLKGEAITPYKQSMHRPMLYVDIRDICKAYEIYASKIVSGECRKTKNSLAHIVNVYYPEPVTILELAGIVRDAIVKYSDSRIEPEIDVVDSGQASTFGEEDENLVRVDVSKALNFFGLRGLKSPRQPIEEIVKSRIVL
jgi:UDP-glucose 4-epimerase